MAKINQDYGSTIFVTCVLIFLVFLSSAYCLVLSYYVSAQFYESEFSNFYFQLHLAIEKLQIQPQTVKVLEKLKTETSPTPKVKQVLDLKTDASDTERTGIAKAQEISPGANIADNNLFNPTFVAKKDRIEPPVSAFQTSSGPGVTNGVRFTPFGQNGHGLSFGTLKTNSLNHNPNVITRQVSAESFGMNGGGGQRREISRRTITRTPTRQIQNPIGFQRHNLNQTYN